MTLQLDETFDQIVETALEGMAFAMTERSDDQDFDWERSDVCSVSIALTKPESGTLLLAMTSESAIGLAESVVGEMGLGTEDALEVLGEVANTIGGLWLIELDPDGHGTELGLPKTSAGALSAQVSGQVVVYDVDEGTLAVLLDAGPGVESC